LVIFFEWDARIIPLGNRCLIRMYLMRVRDSEHALAHSLPDKVEATSRRGDLIEKRKAPMQVWADCCATSIAGAEVTPSPPDHGRMLNFRKDRNQFARP
jgi:hypothetical protein